MFATIWRRGFIHILPRPPPQPQPAPRGGVCATPRLRPLSWASPSSNDPRHRVNDAEGAFHTPAIGRRSGR